MARRLRSVTVTLIDGGVLAKAWKIQDRYRLSFWDALIVAAAKSVGCIYLLTEDLQDDQVLDGLRVVNPFVRKSEDLIEALRAGI